MIARASGRPTENERGRLSQARTIFHPLSRIMQARASATACRNLRNKPHRRRCHRAPRRSAVAYRRNVAGRRAGRRAHCVHVSGRANAWSRAWLRAAEACPSPDHVECNAVWTFSPSSAPRPPAYPLSPAFIRSASRRVTIPVTASLLFPTRRWIVRGNEIPLDTQEDEAAEKLKPVRLLMNFFLTTANLFFHCTLFLREIYMVKRVFAYHVFFGIFTWMRNMVL